MTVGRAQDKAILSLISDQKINPKESLTDQLKKVQEETSSILAETTKTLKH